MATSKKNRRRTPRLSYLGYGVIAILVLSIAAAILLVRPWEQNPQAVTVGLLRIPPSLRYWVAEEEGFFAKYGITVEFKEDYFSTNEVANDLAQNNIDVGHFAMSTVFQVWDIDPNKIFVFTMDLNTSENHVDNLFVLDDSTITRVRDLRGRTIGKFPGEQATIVLTSYLLSEGFEPEEINLVDLPPQNQITALQEQQVDALYAYEPIGTTLTLDYNARTLVNGVTLQVLNPFPGGAGAFSSEFLDARPDVAVNFARAVEEATAFVNDPINRIEVLRILSEHLSIRYDVASQTSWLVWQSVSEIDVDSLQDYADFQFSQGQLFSKIDVVGLLYLYE